MSYLPSNTLIPTIQPLQPIAFTMASKVFNADFLSQLIEYKFQSPQSFGDNLMNEIGESFQNIGLDFVDGVVDGINFSGFLDGMKKRFPDASTFMNMTAPFLPVPIGAFLNSGDRGFWDALTFSVQSRLTTLFGDNGLFEPILNINAGILNAITSKFKDVLQEIISGFILPEFLFVGNEDTDNLYDGAIKR